MDQSVMSTWSEEAVRRPDTDVGSGRYTRTCTRAPTHLHAHARTSLTHKRVYAAGRQAGRLAPGQIYGIHGRQPGRGVGTGKQDLPPDTGAARVRDRGTRVG